MDEVPQNVPPNVAQAQSAAGKRWIGLSGLLLTFLLYWISGAWYSVSWNERGLAYGNPALAEQLYAQWTYLRYGELGLACACLLFIMANRRMRYKRIIAVGIAGIVIAIWVLWFYQPVRCGASLPGFCVPV